MIKKIVLMKAVFPPAIIIGLVGDIVKEDIDIIVMQTSSREEFSIRKTSSSKKQGYVFKCKGKYLNLSKYTSWWKKFSCVSVSSYSAQLKTIVKPIIYVLLTYTF